MCAGTEARCGPHPGEGGPSLLAQIKSDLGSPLPAPSSQAERAEVPPLSDPAALHAPGAWTVLGRGSCPVLPLPLLWKLL